MGNTITGSGSAEPSHPSLRTCDEVAGEGNRLSTRTQDTSSKNMHSAPTLLLNVHELAPPSPRRGRAAAVPELSVENMLAMPSALVSVPPRVDFEAMDPLALVRQIVPDCYSSKESNGSNAGQTARF